MRLFAAVRVWVCSVGSTAIVLAALILVPGSRAQTATEPPQFKVPVPESGFVSPRQYTNAFFGFTLRLPSTKHAQVVDLSESDNALQHFLFAHKSADKGLTLLLVSATQVFSSSEEEAQKAVFLPGTQGQKGAQALSVGHRLFWKNEVEQKTFSGKLRRLRYATAISGYVVQFSASTYNSRVADELRDCLESITFFDPAGARKFAGPDSRPFLPLAARRRLETIPQLDIAHLDPGAVSGSVYSNPFLGFEYHFPEGWYVADKSTQEKIKDTGDSASEDSAETQRMHVVSERCTRVLLWTTKYPEGSRSQQTNPLIAIMAADPTCFAPGLQFPNSVQDVQSGQLVASALARAFAGSPFIGRANTTARMIELAGHIFFEMPSTAAVPIPGSTLLRKIHYSLVVTSMQRYWVIWLFQSDTESELERLMKTSVSFARSEPTPGPESH